MVQHIAVMATVATLLFTRPDTTQMDQIINIDFFLLYGVMLSSQILYVSISTYNIFLCARCKTRLPTLFSCIHAVHDDHLISECIYFWDINA